MDSLQLYGVAGHPIFHSRSPALFNRGFRAVGFPGAYVRLAARNPEEAMALFRELGLQGMNVTAPLKAGLRPLVDETDDVVTAVRALNTVVADGPCTKGQNTDHLGVVGAFETNGVALDGRSFVVLGAGSAGRAAVYGLLRAGAAVTIVNRTPERAIHAAATLGCRSGKLTDLKSFLHDADGLVSTISSAEILVEAGWLRRGLAVLDARYPESPLLKIAEQRGCRVVHGEDWLVHQALPAFRLFTGREPPEREMAEASRDAREPTRKSENISLVGFMGSGKSAVAAALAPRLGYEIVDTDAAVQDREGISIEEIFRRRGEAHFRATEKVLIRQLGTWTGRIVACGGGAVLDAENRRFLVENSTVVWIHAPLRTCLDRIATHPRPLLGGPEAEALSQRLEAARRPYYAVVSDLVVRGEEAADRVAANIHEEIGPSLEA